MSTTDKYKEQVQKEVDSIGSELIGLSDAIHDNPELGLKEHRACELLTSRIESHGFLVEKPVVGLNTAFTAVFGDPAKKPKIAFLAEYDCVPGLGHACGHNIIAAACFGAAVAVKKVTAELGGTVALFGTPDEEAVDPVSKGGKVVMAEAGLFDDLDAALMVHPTAGSNAVWRYSFPLKDFSVRYLGRPAHYTVPHEGINALEALLMFISNVNTMKRGWMPDVMFAYTITDGGGPSALTVPKSAEAHITMKAFYSQYLDELYARVEACAQSVAAVTGAKLEMRVISEYKNMIPNLNLALGLYKNLRALGAKTDNPVDSQRALERLTYPGISTDFADVSWVTAGIHGYCSIGGDGLVAHTHEFADAARSERGHEAVILSAKALAMTAVDILANPEFYHATRAEFEQYRAANFANVPGIPPHYLPLPKYFIEELL